MVDIANRVRALRSHVKKSQEKFAEEIKISRSTLALIETDKAIPSYEAINNMCSVYKIVPSYFFDEGEVEIGNYILNPNIASKLENRKKNTFEAAPWAYGKHIKDKLTNNLKTNHKDLFDLYEALNDIPYLVWILSEFIPNSIEIEDISHPATYAKFKNSLPVNAAQRLGYEEYSSGIISWLKTIKPEQKKAILDFRKHLRQFLLAMKPLDEQGDIILSDE